MNLLPRLLLTSTKVVLAFAYSMPVFPSPISDSSDIGAEQRQENIELSEQAKPTELTRKVKVIIRVYVDVDGRQLQKEVSQSSGYPKIDKEALARAC
mgnify:FL=1